MSWHPVLISTIFEPVSPQELAATLGDDPKTAENFLRMAVMVALADGVYSVEEDDQLQAFLLHLKSRRDPSILSAVYPVQT